MKRELIGLFLIFLFFSTQAELKKFVILIASYNNEPLTRSTLLSAFQNYPEDSYKIIFIDDASTDATFEAAHRCVCDYKKEHLVSFIKNDIRMGAMYNHWFAIHAYIPDDWVVVILDGDDQLANNNVLHILNNIYQNSDIWLTYGQYCEKMSRAIGFCHEYPKYIIRQNLFRQFRDIPSHLRTFYAGLFKRIKKEDLMKDGEFLEMCADMATMIPMIEMAGDHFSFVPHILYIYNDVNPLSDHRKSKELQQKLDCYIRNLPAYQPLCSGLIFNKRAS